ncbi:hypothetical protein [Jiangella muralis]|uniref:hypothetical protein n=1 Tax=Jiangella muralis TaxID=702383 RepID=UPI001F0B5CB3|nr:hypothetical protein [Jiangella muralis]
MAALIGTGIYGLIRGPGDTTTPGEPAAATSAVEPAPLLTTPAPAIPILPRTGDPVIYARAVAEALFTWDTMSRLLPADYASIVIADADPSGYETNGLAADMANYLPTEETWQRLREYRTAQTLTIHDAYVPESWPGIVSAAGDQLTPGTVAVTIEGTRHRYGTWFGRSETSDHDVAFTAFVACPPAFERCHILRLSRLDNPLT